MVVNRVIYFDGPISGYQLVYYWTKFQILNICFLDICKFMHLRRWDEHGHIDKN